MKIQIIYDNEVLFDELGSDWGFSCIVEHNNRKILFDTGTNGALLLQNMKSMKIDPTSIDTVFISHSHFDHSGGLSAFLNVNPHVAVYAPPPLRGIHPAKKVIYVEDYIKIDDCFHSTGLLKDIEQSLVINTEKGLVLVVGCSHPGLEVILNASKELGKPYMVAGGLHGFDDYKLLEEFKFICPTHCTQNIKKIKELYPDKYIQGGAGKVIEL